MNYKLKIGREVDKVKVTEESVKEFFQRRDREMLKNIAEVTEEEKMMGDIDRTESEAELFKKNKKEKITY